MDEDIKKQKKELRKEIKRKIEDLSRDYKIQASLEISKKIFGDLNYQSANTIFTFVGTDGEPDTKKIIEEAINSGKRVCVPRCIDSNKMIAVEIKNYLEDLEIGSYGILEPIKGLPIVEKSHIDYGIIPCVTCDKEGNRLGHGKGYYDIFLKDCDFSTRMLCYSKLMLRLGEIPLDDNDVTIDMVISD